MGQIHHVPGMFRGVTYNRFSTEVLRERMGAKVHMLADKIKERQGRIEKIMSEHGITSEMLSDMLVQYMKDQERGHSRMSYNTASMAAGPNLQQKNEVAVPAGVVANIVTEKGLVESETEEANRMILIMRNLRDTLPSVDEKTGTLIERAVVHTLTDEEIDYLGL